MLLWIGSHGTVRILWRSDFRSRGNIAAPPVKDFLKMSCNSDTLGLSSFEYVCLM